MFSAYSFCQYIYEFEFVGAYIAPTKNHPYKLRFVYQYSFYTLDYA